MHCACVCLWRQAQHHPWLPALRQARVPARALPPTSHHHRHHHSALQAATSCDLLLVVGSSLMVWSAFRLAKAAADAGGRLAIVNVGPTRADGLAAFKAEALAGEVLAQLARHPALLVPRGA